MRFLADMGVDVRVVEWLRHQAHDAKHLRDEGLQRSPDGEIFAKAVAEDRVGGGRRGITPARRFLPIGQGEES